MKKSTVPVGVCDVADVGVTVADAVIGWWNTDGFGLLVSAVAVAARVVGPISATL
ncbi:hypothetical protein [Streptomyces sp. AgN23]|uniref:hypothetical protein n=1 Tax=Streptomyces sp. AgN23 TaxID=1188315 RepID=UPI001B33A832|nr:hypothetical protein [Streptomyces sp. AgN23]QTI90481.1 hypothetical protein AS97_60205 [Streptomyces sp. AgN23]